MKKIFCTLLIALLFQGLHGQTIYPSGVSGCIARWTFDSPEGGGLPTIQDESGNNNHGNNNNIISTTGWKGYPNTAGAFDGTGSFSQVPYVPMLSPNAVTAMALIKFKGFYSGNCQGNNIVYSGFNYNADLNWAMYSTDGNYDNSCGTYSPAYNKMQFVTPNFTNTTIPLNNFIDTSKWYLFVCTFNGTVNKNYQIEMDINNHINNITPSYIVNNSNPAGNGAYDVFLGATQNPPFPYWFNGKMDEVILFNKELTNSEVQSVYDYLFGFANSVKNTDKDNDDVAVLSNNKIITAYSSTTNLVKAEVYDVNGKILKQVSLKTSKQIDLSQFSSQIIFIKLYTDNQKIIFKKISI